MRRKMVAGAFAVFLNGAATAAVYESYSEFAAVAGTPQSMLDFAMPILPSCADASYYQAQGEVIGNSCVASSAIVDGQRIYTMRGDVWASTINVRSGNANGAGPGGPNTAYGAHLWNGPGTFLRADPTGGTYLAIEQYRPLMTLGVFTTAGFFGWLVSPEQSDLGLLVLPEGAQITKLEFEYLTPVPLPATGALLMFGLVALSVGSRSLARAHNARQVVQNG